MENVYLCMAIVCMSQHLKIKGVCCFCFFQPFFFCHSALPHRVVTTCSKKKLSQDYLRLYSSTLMFMLHKLCIQMSCLLENTKHYTEQYHKFTKKGKENKTHRNPS